MRAEGRLRRLISRQARDSQCNGFLHDGASAWLPAEAPAGAGGKEGRGRAWSPSWHRELDQAGPEGGDGPSSLPGNQQRALRRAEGDDPGATRAGSVRPPLPVPWIALPDGKPGQRGPALPIMGSSLQRQVPACPEVGISAPGGSSGVGLLLSSAPTLGSHLPLAGGKGVRGGRSS